MEIVRKLGSHGKSVDAPMALTVLAMALAWSIDAGAPLERWVPFVRWDYLFSDHAARWRR